MKWCTKLDVAYIYRRGALLFSRSSVKFQGHSAKKSSILTQIGRFRTVTQVWIYQWLWNDAQSLKQHRGGALLIFKVICQISRSHGTKKLPSLTWIEHFRTVTPVWIHPWLWNDAQSLMYYRRGALLFSKVIHQISRSHGRKYHQFRPELRVYGLYNYSLNTLMDLKWSTKLDIV